MSVIPAAFAHLRPRLLPGALLALLAASLFVGSVTSGPPAPNINATKSDVLSNDADGDTVASPGDTLTYTVTITNKGTADAQKVNFSDKIGTNTTFVGGSLDVTPVARNDKYSVIGNVSITVPDGASDLLANDVDPDGGTVTATVVSGGSTTAGGDIDIAANGSFTYDPLPGFDGTDTFVYTITDNEADTDTATVTFNVSTPIWFIDNTSGSPGDGRLSDPFSSEANYNTLAADAIGDIIFIDEGDGTTTGYSTGIALLDSQQLIGQGVDLATAASITPPTFSATLPGAAGKPKITNAAGPGVTVSNKTGTAIRGLDITGSTIGIDIDATSGTKTVAVSDSNIKGTSTGHGVDVSSSGTATLEIAFDRNAVESGGASFAGASFVGASFTPGSGAAIITSFTNNSVNPTTSAVGTGIKATMATFDSNTGNGTINTAGTRDAVAAGTLTIGNSGGTSRAKGAGILLTSAKGDLTFTSVDVYNDGGTGIELANSGLSAGDFTLTIGSGPIDTATGAAIDLDPATSAVTLTSVKSTNATGPGIRLESLSGNFTVTGAVDIDNSGGPGIDIDSTSATVTFSGTSKAITNTTSDGIDLTSYSGTITFSNGGLDIDTTSGIGFDATGSGTVNVSGANNTIDSTTGKAIDIDGNASMTLGVTFKSISNNGGANGIDISDTTGSFTVTGDGSTAASGGTIQNSTSDGISLNDVTNVSLSFMGISSPAGHGIMAIDLGGTNTFDDGTISGVSTASKDAINVDNNGTDLTLNVTDSTLTGTTTGDDAIYFKGIGTGGNPANMTLVVDEIDGTSLFQGFKNTSIDAGGKGDAVGEVVNTNVTVKDTTFQNAAGVAGKGGNMLINLQPQESGSMVYLIDNNIFNSVGRNTLAAAGLLNILCDDSTTSSGTISNNDIDDITGLNAIDLRADDACQAYSANVHMNTIDDVLNKGIRVHLGDNTSGLTMNVQIKDNLLGTITALGTDTVLNTGLSTGEQEGIEVRAFRGNGSTMNLLMTGNTVITSNTFSSEEPLDIDSEDNNTINATVTGNTFTINGGGAQSVDIESEKDTGVSSTLCLDYSGNTTNLKAHIEEEPGTSFSIEDVASIVADNPSSSLTFLPNFAAFSNATSCTTPPAKPTATPTPGVMNAPMRPDEDAGAAIASAASVSGHPFEAGLLVLAAGRSGAVAGPGWLDGPVRRSRPLDSKPLGGEGVAASTTAAVDQDLGTLNAGQVVTIKFDVTVNAGAVAAGQVCNQGTVSGNNFSNVSTDDPDTGASGDTTCTPVPSPDLTATKSNDVGGNVVLGANWTWTVTVANGDAADAVFMSGETILSDNLPNTNIAYGAVSIGSVTNVTNSGNISCAIVSFNLTCSASGATVTVGATAGTFAVSFKATPSAAGQFDNPRGGGACSVDPGTNVSESNESNNPCSDKVTVVVPDLTATKSNDVSDKIVIGDNWTWTVAVANGGTGDATFASGETILVDDLPNSNVTYGTPATKNLTGISGAGTISCGITTFTLTCTASGGNVIIANTTGGFEVNVKTTPSASGQFDNPRGGGACTVDPGTNVPEGNETNNACGDKVAVNGLDFGDAPDPTYPTLLASNGARHVQSALLLGASVDEDADGQPNATATGDDTDGNDDEDGVAFTSAVVQDLKATIDVTSSGAGLLDAWVDYNGDGDWADAGELIFSSEALAAGVNSLSYFVPAGATLGDTFARFRVSTAGGLATTGLAGDGEVEDYQVTIVPPVPDHYRCYNARDRSSPRFAEVVVQLIDQFESKQTRVRRPELLCNPVDKDGESIIDPAAHLVCYQIRDASGQPGFQRREVAVKNQFGEQTLTLRRAETLCVPAEKEGVSSVLNLDRFKCYSTDRGQPRLTERIVELADQFEDESVRVRHPSLLCAPVDKEGAGVLNPGPHFVCYPTRDLPGSPSLARRDVTVEDQFGALTLRVPVDIDDDDEDGDEDDENGDEHEDDGDEGTPSTLCVPSEKQSVGPPTTGGGDDDDDDDDDDEDEDEEEDDDED